MSDSLQPHESQHARPPCPSPTPRVHSNTSIESVMPPWDFPGKNTGVGGYFLLQGIFLTQGLNPSSPALAGGFFTTEPPGKKMLLWPCSSPLSAHLYSPEAACCKHRGLCLKALFWPKEHTWPRHRESGEHQGVHGSALSTTVSQ